MYDGLALSEGVAGRPGQAPSYKVKGSEIENIPNIGM